MALGTNGIDVPCSVCDRPDPTPVELAHRSLASPAADVRTLAACVIAQAEELAKLRADNDVLRTQVEYRAEPLGLDDWARQLLDKYTGYPHVNADPFDSLDMGQRQALIWEYASELLVRGKRIEVLRAALTEALDMLGEFEHFNDARIAELRLLL